MTVALAKGQVEAFPVLRYRLEHHASAFDEVARSQIDARSAVGKDAARFDIVLLNRKNNVPRCIIEVKRGTRILDDAKRILAIASLGSGRPRWRHGYLVTVLRRSETEAQRIVDELCTSIEALRHAVSGALPEHERVKVTAEMRRIGDSRLRPETTQIYGVVFHVALLDGTARTEDLQDGLQEIDQ